MADLRGPGTPIDLEKMRSISVLGHRSRSTVVSGRSHPESGLPWQATTDSEGNTVTEHSVPMSGVACRQDVTVRPDTVSFS